MTARQARDSIEVGSVSHGERAGLEAKLGQVIGGGPDGGAPVGQVPVSPAPTPENPLGALLGGGVVPGGEQGPLTSGLTVGAGPSPNANDPMQSDAAVRLRNLAEQASTPSLRAAARRMLKRLDSQGERL